jgi:hypothetical protein
MKTLSLSQRTKQLIGNMAKINESLLFRPGDIQYTWACANKGQGRIDPIIFATAKFAEEIPSKFAIADLSKFLNILSLYEEPKMSFQDDVMYIRGKDGRSFRYMTTPIGNINSPHGEMELDKSNIITEFDLSSGALQHLNRILAVAELGQVKFKGTGTEVVLMAVPKDEGKHSDSTDMYAQSLGSSNKKFTIIYDAYKMQTLMENNYHVTLAEGFSEFKGPDIEYLMSPELSTIY